MSKEMTIELLEGGRDAFPEIIRQIRAAKSEITVHMFIWREDRIGTEIARELITAADRGVKVTIEKDMHAVTLEYAEESQRSLCHRPNPGDRFTIFVLTLIYNRELVRNRLNTSRSSLYTKMKEHPNIALTDGNRTYDHSKYYIFDREVIILGGMNIEDKEYYSDIRGRIYHDYMIKISDPTAVAEFLEKRRNPKMKSELFKVNMKEPSKCFEIKSSYLELIDAAERELNILMAYFAPDKDILSAIKRALQRGVHVRIIIPQGANFNDDTNKLTVLKLLDYSKANAGKLSGRLEIYMTEKMLHAKLLASEKQIIIGSSNINKRSFTQLDELALAVCNDDSPFAAELLSSISNVLRDAECVRSGDRIKYSPLLAAMEIAVM